MPGPASGVSEEIQAAVCGLSERNSRAVHHLQLALARLLLGLSPPFAASHLALVERFLQGTASEAELIEARQDCWSYAGSLACGCSDADTLSTRAILACLDTSASAHTLVVLLEQAEWTWRCGVSEQLILGVLSH